MFLARGSLLFLLLTTLPTAMSLQIQSEGFPALPPDYIEMARKMLVTCMDKGYDPPILNVSMKNSSLSKPDKMAEENPILLFASLISSLPLHPLLNNSNETKMDSNLTEKMCNSSNLPQMIRQIWNTTEKNNCFMRMFLAPFAWMAIVKNASEFDSDELKSMLWASKPYLEMYNSSFMLPKILSRSQLDDIMKTFNEVYICLPEEQRNNISQWVKEKIIELDPGCPQNRSNVSNSTMSAPPPNVTGCQPKMMWLKAEVLGMMGRFLTQLSEAELTSIDEEELCKFFQSSKFEDSFSNVKEMRPEIGKIFMKQLKKNCFDAKNLSQHMDRFGALICYLYDDPQSLNATQAMKLLSKLKDFESNESKEMRKQLINKLVSDHEFLSIEMLSSLGDLISISSPSTLSILNKTEWKPAKAKILAQKLLAKHKINGSTLVSLGTLMRGVDSNLLKKVKLQGLLGNKDLKTISERLSPLQKKALLVGLRSDVNASELVKSVPDDLISSLPLSVLDKANLMLAQLRDRHWSSTQSIYLLKKIVGNELNPAQIRNLGPAVQGMTCEMIDSIPQSDVLNATQTLSMSFNLLSRTQVRCVAKKLFQNLEKQKLQYFKNISKSELQAIPALLFIHLPVQVIEDLPVSVCPEYLKKISSINLSFLPNNAPARQGHLNKALRCLGNNTSEVSTDDIVCLSQFVCELDPTWISSLKSAAQNITVRELASCKHIPHRYRDPLFTLLTNLYGAPSNWSEDTVKFLGTLVLLNDTIDKLPLKSWLKESLTDLQQRMKPQVAAQAQDEFRYWPDFSTLRRKLFQLITKSPQQRHKRQTQVPTLEMIQTLGDNNIFWTPSELSIMTDQTFIRGVSNLGEIPDYSTDQLSVIREKAIQIWGDLSMLSETKLMEIGCLSQSLNTTELKNITITSLNTLEILSICKWKQNKREAIVQSFMKGTGTNMTELTALEMTGLGQFICGLQDNEIGELKNTEFKDAMEDIGQASCPLNVLQGLKKKAIAVCGDPKSWSEADVRIMGNIIAGLNGTELRHLNPSVMPFIRQSAIPLIPPECLVALSPSQLKAFSPENAASLTSSQRARLTDEQKEALDEALGMVEQKSETTTPVPQKGGAPKQSLLEIVLLLQPLVLLLLGYIG